MATNAENYSAEDTGRATRSVTPAGLRAFVEAAYGLSVHWGLYAINGRGEWVMHQERIPFEAYQERLGGFNPTRFNAEEWADLMLEAGQKFLVITTKHHDGFCMWDTALTEWKITNTPFGRDVLAELAPALRDRGLKLYYYYSLLDWTHPAYRSDWPAYVAYYQGHLRELLTHYGEVGAVIFDGYWPRTTFGPAEAHFPPRGEWDPWRQSLLGFSHASLVSRIIRSSRRSLLRYRSSVSHAANEWANHPDWFIIGVSGCQR